MMMRIINIVALVCQVVLMIIMGYEYLKTHDSYLLLGAVGWFAAACYNLGSLTRTE
jgi:hypothetical protein